MRTKKFILWGFMFMILMLTSCTVDTGANPIESDLYEENLRGSVARIETIVDNIPSQPGVATNTLITEFNDDGMVIKKEYHNRGKKIWSSELIYEEGKLIKSISTKDSSQSTALYIYNDKGSLIAIEKAEPDDKGSNSSSRPSSSVIKNVEVEINESENLETYNYYNITDKIHHSIETKYNEYNKVIYKKMTWYFTDRTDIFLEEYKYDDDNNCIEYISSQNKEHNLTRKLTNDVYGNYTTQTTTYADNGRIEVLEYKYTYDKHDNWIKQEEYNDGVLARITTRTITYK